MSSMRHDTQGRVSNLRPTCNQRCAPQGSDLMVPQKDRSCSGSRRMSQEDQILDCVKACTAMYDQLPGVGWPFRAIGSMATAVYQPALVSGNDLAMIAAFLFLWQVTAYSRSSTLPLRIGLQPRCECGLG